MRAVRGVPARICSGGRAGDAAVPPLLPQRVRRPLPHNRTAAAAALCDALYSVMHALRACRKDHKWRGSVCTWQWHVF